MHGELLGSLEPGVRRVVEANLTRRSYRAGDTLFFEGDRGDSLHLIQHGRVAVRTSTTNGDVVTLTVLGPGDCVGELALVGEVSDRSASVVALDPVESLVLVRRDFDEARRRDPGVERFLVELLVRMVKRLSAGVLEAMYVPAETRVVRRLAEVARMPTTGGGRDIVIPMRQEDVASMAGTTRPTANRVLKQLESSGVLTIGRGRVVVLDLPELERLAR